MTDSKSARDADDRRLAILAVWASEVARGRGEPVVPRREDENDFEVRQSRAEDFGQ